MHAATGGVRDASLRKGRGRRAWVPWLGGVGLALVLASNAAAQIYKCIDASGRVLYGDVPCPSGSRGEVLETKEPPVAATPVPAERAPVPKALPVVRPQVPANASADGIATRTTTQAQRYELSVNERQRVANLEQVQRSADSSERREAARIEIAEIQRGTLARMSYDDLRRKDALWADLGDADAGKRQTAVQQLTALFATYR